MARLQHDAFFVGGYDYTIILNTGTLKFKIMQMIFPIPLEKEIRNEAVDPVGVFKLKQFDPVTVTMDSIGRETQRSCLDSRE